MVLADCLLSPAWWPAQVGCRLDAGGYLVDGHCEVCGRREGVRHVLCQLDDLGIRGGLVRFCTRCLLGDMGDRPASPLPRRP